MLLSAFTARLMVIFSGRIRSSVTSPACSLFSVEEFFQSTYFQQSLESSFCCWLCSVFELPHGFGLHFLAENQSQLFISFIYNHWSIGSVNNSFGIGFKYTDRFQICYIFYLWCWENFHISCVRFSMYCYYVGPLVIVLPVLGLEMKTKTIPTRSRLSSSSYSTSTVTTFPTPSQSDTFCYRHLKTDSDYHSYLTHFGYYLRHSGYILDIVTISWVTVTLIVLGNLNFKNASSCCLHDLRNIGLDSIQSPLCALTHSDFVFKINLTLYVWSSPLRERRFFETVFRSDGIDLIGKNLWKYYNMCDCFMILNNLCKVFDYLNLFYQYKLWG